MKKLSFITIILALVIVSCSKQEDYSTPVSNAGDAELRNSLQVVELNAVGQYNSRASKSDCVGMLNSGNGSSQATGEFIVSGSNCSGTCGDGDPFTASLSNPEMTLMISSGDKLFITYTEGCYLMSSDCYNPYGEFPCQSYRGYYEITGGTGVYANAQGEGEIHITQYLKDENGEITGSLSDFELNGTLIYSWSVAVENNHHFE